MLDGILASEVSAMFRTSTVVAAVFAFSTADAQLVEPGQTSEQVNLEAQPPLGAQAFGDAFQPFPRPYAANTAGQPVIKSALDVYRTDPKLQFGLTLTPTFGIELGFANLLSRGFHYLDDSRPAEKAGVLGDHGFSSYAAAKFTVPVTERFTAYSKLGIAHSESKMRERPNQPRQTQLAKDPIPAADTGPYASVGAQYKLNAKAALSGEVVKSGSSATKWPGASNATGVSTRLKIGF
ncbi:hypothetical protein E4L96_21150 [Massilia arenosa]|uniref:Porin family protein n=1 Tax=Zemynaea arenosa TaxID=2561931 RepID=A0A4Y9RQU5_9BURK|nr:hypothetical protein [Massilia arenosa]TFW11454.1 hypothetical protein E4L96_21150 [Massilia arenosa]